MCFFVEEVVWNGFFQERFHVCIKLITVIKNVSLVVKAIQFMIFLIVSLSLFVINNSTLIHKV